MHFLSIYQASLNIMDSLLVSRHFLNSTMLSMVVDLRSLFDDKKEHIVLRTFADIVDKDSIEFSPFVNDSFLVLLFFKV